MDAHIISCNPVMHRNCKYNIHQKLTQAVTRTTESLQKPLCLAMNNLVFLYFSCILSYGEGRVNCESSGAGLEPKQG